jgi:hypothetical protein
MKKLFEFNVPKEVEIEEIETSKNEKGEEIKITKKNKTKEQVKVFIRKPTRALFDEAELFYGVRLSEGIKAGLLTRALLSKRFTNDGGVLSEEEKNVYATLYVALFEKQNEFQKLSIKDESERTEAEKARYKKIIGELTQLRTEIQDFETAQASLFDQTAENRARNKTILWWVLQLGYYINEKSEELPFFGQGEFESKLRVYDTIEETGSEFENLVCRKLAYFVSFWYVGRAASQEDFERLASLSSETSAIEEAVQKEETKEEVKKSDS